MLIKANAVYEKFSKTIKKTTKNDVTGLHVTFSQTILKKLEPEGQAEATNSGHSKANRKHICLQNKPYLC